jgi:hypothetical protein
MPTTLCGGSEQLDIADHRHAEAGRMRLDRVGVERHAGADHHARIAGKVGFERVGDGGAAHEGCARFGTVVPRQHFGPARQQRFHRGAARSRQAIYGIALAAPGRTVDHS